MAMILMGSRSALLCLVVFGIVGIAWGRGGVAKCLLWVTALATFATVWSYAEPERFTSLVDRERELTRFATWNAIVENGWTAFRGTGLGSIWPWYGPTGRAAYAISVMMNSDYGPTLFHPHSILNLMAAEFGLPGIIYLAGMVGIILVLFWRARGGPYGFLATGLATTMALGLSETILFKNSELAVIWWSFLFGALRLVGHHREVKRTNARAGDRSPWISP
jgi:hypothetical protein